MAKLSGPEEFFEVFRRDDPNKPPAPAEPEQPHDEQRQPAPALVFPAGLATKPAGEKTIAVRFSTLIFTAVCVLLLMVLSYFAGKANRSDAAANRPAKPSAMPAKPQFPNTFGVNVLNTQPPQAAGQKTQGQQPAASQAEGKVVLEVMRYNDASRVKSADELTAFLKGLPAVRSNAVGVGYDVNGNDIVVWIGPFISDRSQAAREVQNEVINSPYNGRKRFQNSTSFRLAQQHR